MNDNDLYLWEILIIGPVDTLYEGGFFKATLHFSPDYPIKPPKMKVSGRLPPLAPNLFALLIVRSFFDVLFSF